MENKEPANKIRQHVYRILRWTCVVLAVPLAIALYSGVLQWSGNFRVAIPGELYRSAQPSAADIAAYSQRYGIKSVLNLRGDNTGSPWYDDEIAASKAAGVAHMDFRMSSGRELTAEQASQLIAMMRAAPKPLWIHCQAGADRSGLAVALYLAAIAGQAPDVATHALSLRYGHLPFVINKAAAMDRSWEALQPLVLKESVATR